MKSDLSKIKVGDKIWTIEDGWINVISIERDENYPIYTKNNTYTFDGKVNIGDKYPSAFLEYPFKEEPIEKDTLVWFRDSEKSSWIVGYYSHFEDGRHYCFDASLKSIQTSDRHSWNIVTTKNPLI